MIERWLDATSWMGAGPPGRRARARVIGRALTTPDPSRIPLPSAPVVVKLAFGRTGGTPEGTEWTAVRGVRLRHRGFAVVSAGVTGDQLAALIAPRSSSGGRLHTAAVAAVLKLAGEVMRFASQRATVAFTDPSELWDLARSLGPTFATTEGRNDRTYVRVWAETGTLSAVAKVVCHPVDRRALDRERRFLESSTATQLGGSVPVVLATGETAAFGWLVTTAGTGGPCPTVLPAYLRAWLDRLESEETHVALRGLPLVRHLEARALTHPDQAWARLWSALDELLAGVTGPAAIVHGDFAPWNILVEDERPFVYDWETVEPSGVACWDRVFFDLQVGIVKRGWTGQAVASCAGRLIQELEGLGRSSRFARAVVVCVLMHIALEHDREGNQQFGTSARAGTSLTVDALRRGGASPNTPST